MNRINTAARFAPGIVEGPLLKKPLRFNAIPLATAGGAPTIGLTVVPQSAKRVSLLLANLGTANVYISTVQLVSTFDWVIAPGMALSWPGSDGPTAPLNAIYATADVGHDLRVLETILAPLLGTEFQA